MIFVVIPILLIGILKPETCYAQSLKTSEYKLELDAELMLKASEVIVDLRLQNKLLSRQNKTLHTDLKKVSQSADNSNTMWIIIISVVVPCVLALGIGTGYAIGNAR